MEYRTGILSIISQIKTTKDKEIDLAYRKYTYTHTEHTHTLNFWKKLRTHMHQITLRQHTLCLIIAVMVTFYSTVKCLFEIISWLLYYLSFLKSRDCKHICFCDSVRFFSHNQYKSLQDNCICYYRPVWIFYYWSEQNLTELNRDKCIILKQTYLITCCHLNLAWKLHMNLIALCISMLNGFVTFILY